MKLYILPKIVPKFYTDLERDLLRQRQYIFMKYISNRDEFETKYFG